jgi:GMP synthase-like glutamine amidotransferase
MKLGILNTDAVKPEFAQKYGEYPDMFAEILIATDPQLKLVTYEVVEGEYPADINEVDGYLITGSKLSVYDDVPWINDLKDFVRALNETKKKVIGICFGHQLVAEALGGKTEPAVIGWCVGAHLNKATEIAKGYGIKDAEFQLPSNHKDQVTALPTGGKLLASTDACPIAAIGVGDHILTFQGHPEFGLGYATDLLNMRREIIGEVNYQTAISSLETKTDNLKVARWILEFINR